jgi:Tol biopolymer transport system component
VGARALPGTEDAVAPFWSADSRWVGFFAEGKLKQILATGGAVQTVTETAPSPFGGAWSGDDTILFSWGNNPLLRVPVVGGTLKPVTKLDASGESHRWPHVLPDGRYFLFTVRSPERPGIFAGSFDGVTKKFLLRADSRAVYAPPGYLLWVDGNALLGQAVDADHLELSGRPFTVAEGVGRSTASESAVSVSSTGALAYAGVIVRHGRLTWFDRSGNALDSMPLEGDHTDFRLSPDETKVAASLVDPTTNIPNVWLIDLAAKRPSPLTAGSFNTSAVWSPDGTRLMFRTLRNGLIEFYQKSAFGGGNEDPVLSIATQRASGAETGSNLVPTDWSRDGHVLFSNPGTTSRFDLWLFRPADKDSKPVRLLGSASDEIQANFSPDGRLLAYTSNETGRFQVYVQTLPLSDRKWTISTNGGYEPRWRGDGRERYYLAEDRALMSVSISDGPSFGVPRPLFQTRVPVGVHPLRSNYVPTRDGQRFLVNTHRSDAPPAPITVVLNWQEALK